MDLDTIIADVESILRVRTTVRNARETLARTTTELVGALANLKEREAALAKAVGAEPTSTWHDATLKVPGGWTVEAAVPPSMRYKARLISPDTVTAVGSVPAMTPLHIVEKNSKRQRFDRIRKGDVVWMSRAKALGTVQKIDRYGVHEVGRISDGKVFLCMARNLWRPLPDEEMADAKH